MKNPEEAVHAAAMALCVAEKGPEPCVAHLAQARAALSAAAPLIQAQALREAAEDVKELSWRPRVIIRNSYVAQAVAGYLSDPSDENRQHLIDELEGKEQS